MRSKFLLLFLPLALHALPGYHAPWGKDADLRTLPQEEAEAAPSIPVRVAQKIIRFHQNVLSPVDGPRSHFIPSSSQYMYLSMQKYGFVEGFIMGCDRLMRENGDDWVYRKVEIDGKLYKTDPIR